jgi:hypothetical protein
MPEGMMTTLAAGGSPALVARDDARYPLARLLDLIDALQLAPGGSAVDVAAARQDPLAVVRYWTVAATLGSPRAVPATGLLQDPDASVRVVAATAEARGGNAAAAEAVLAAALDKSQPEGVRLAALNSVSLLPAVPAAIRPVLLKLADTEDKTDYLARVSGTLLSAAP